MTVNKLENGMYQARFQFDRRRYKRTFKTSKEARAWEADTLRQLAAGESPVIAKDKRRLSELVEMWYQLHGKALKDGTGRKNKLICLANIMGDPPAHRITAKLYTQFRAQRLESGITASTCNHDLAYLKALFNELIRHEGWNKENPLRNVRKLKLDEIEMRYLTKEEIQLLLYEVDKSRNPSLYKVVRICLQTGARWSEANDLLASNVKVDGGRAWIVFEGTKSGRVRRVPIDLEFAKDIRSSQIGARRLFEPCIGAFRTALDRTEIELPRGQASHVLRHTFASHYMMNGGDILRLQKLLGHSTVVMTMRYAHLAPDALEDVLDKHALA